MMNREVTIHVWTDDGTYLGGIDGSPRFQLAVRVKDEAHRTKIEKLLSDRFCKFGRKQ